MKTIQLLLGGLGLAVVAPTAIRAADSAVSAAIPSGYKLVYEQTFAKGEPLKQFVFTDASAWKLSGEGADRALELVKQSAYQPEVRSPVNIALIADQKFGDFILEADLVQTGKEYGHRDMCLFFGLQNPKQFYYVHLATKADANAHNIFIVNNAPRKNFAEKTTDGVKWGLEVWHHVRLERSFKAGTIRVFFDDMERPIMEAKDGNYGPGYIGFGSFDDTGKVKNVRIWSPETPAPEKTTFYQRP